MSHLPTSTFNANIADVSGEVPENQPCSGNVPPFQSIQFQSKPASGFQIPGEDTEVESVMAPFLSYKPPAVLKKNPVSATTEIPSQLCRTNHQEKKTGKTRIAMFSALLLLWGLPLCQSAVPPVIRLIDLENHKYVWMIRNFFPDAVQFPGDLNEQTIPYMRRIETHIEDEQTKILPVTNTLILLDVSASVPALITCGNDRTHYFLPSTRQTELTLPLHCSFESRLVNITRKTGVQTDLSGNDNIEVEVYHYREKMDLLLLSSKDVAVIKAQTTNQKKIEQAEALETIRERKAKNLWKDIRLEDRRDTLNQNPRVEARILKKSNDDTSILGSIGQWFQTVFKVFSTYLQKSQQKSEVAAAMRPRSKRSEEQANNLLKSLNEGGEIRQKGEESEAEEKSHDDTSTWGSIVEWFPWFPSSHFSLHPLTFYRAWSLQKSQQKSEVAAAMRPRSKRSEEQEERKSSEIIEIIKKRYKMNDEKANNLLTSLKEEMKSREIVEGIKKRNKMNDEAEGEESEAEEKSHDDTSTLGSIVKWFSIGQLFQTVFKTLGIQS